eukprot:scaffold2195_cov333-Pavlova_lutheri.AAC.3
MLRGIAVHVAVDARQSGSVGNPDQLSAAESEDIDSLRVRLAGECRTGTTMPLQYMEDIGVRNHRCTAFILPSTSSRPLQRRYTGIAQSWF